MVRYNEALRNIKVNANKINKGIINGFGRNKVSPMPQSANQDSNDEFENLWGINKEHPQGDTMGGKTDKRREGMVLGITYGKCIYLDCQDRRWGGGG